MIKETIVVIGMLTGQNLRVDEGINGLHISLQVFWNVKVHSAGVESINDNTEFTAVYMVSSPHSGLGRDAEELGDMEIMALASPNDERFQWGCKR